MILLSTAKELPTATFSVVGNVDEIVQLTENKVRREKDNLSWALEALFSGICCERGEDRQKRNSWQGKGIRDVVIISSYRLSSRPDDTIWTNKEKIENYKAS